MFEGAVWVSCQRCSFAVEQPAERQPTDDFGEWLYRLRSLSDDLGGWFCARCAEAVKLEDRVAHLEAKLDERGGSFHPTRVACATCDRVTAERAAIGSGAWRLDGYSKRWRCPQCVQLREALEMRDEAQVLAEFAEQGEQVARERERWLAAVLATRLQEVAGLRVAPNDGPIEELFAPDASGPAGARDHWWGRRYKAFSARLSLFAHVMAWEVRQNAHKGDWVDADPLDLAEDALYHVLKLVVAVDEGDHAAVLEYAADTANLALMVADRVGALAVEHMSPQGGSGGYVKKPYGERLDDARRLASEWALVVLRSTARDRQVRRLLAVPPSPDLPF